MEKPTFPKIKRLTPDEIRETRKVYRISQREFGRYFPVSMDTVRSWENGRSNPYGPCNIRLQELKAYADHVRSGREAALEGVLKRKAPGGAPG